MSEAAEIARTAARTGPEVARGSIAFAAGFLAEREGRSSDANPYTPNTLPSHRWAAGWLAAREHPLPQELPR